MDYLYRLFQHLIAAFPPAKQTNNTRNAPRVGFMSPPLYCRHTLKATGISLRFGVEESFPRDTVYYR